MPTLAFLDDLSDKLSQALPAGLKETQEDLKKNFTAILQANFAKMNLVTREEFDKQTALLQKARETLITLTKRLDEYDLPPNYGNWKSVYNRSHDKK